MTSAFPVRFPDQLRQHLRALRKAHGLTQAQLGALVGVSQARIAEIEAKPGLVNFEQLMKLLSVLGVTVTVVGAEGFPAPGIAEARARFESTLKAHQPQPTPALAAPGLSPHGQMHAVDFQVWQGALTVAGPSTSQVQAVWVGQGWRDRLESAVRLASDKFRGPLQNPDEPWHYDYQP